MTCTSPGACSTLMFIALPPCTASIAKKGAPRKRRGAKRLFSGGRMQSQARDVFLMSLYPIQTVHT